MLIARKNLRVGLDIGSHSIKLVEIDHTGKGMVLKNVGLIGLPPDAIVEGSIEAPEIIASRIRRLFKNLKVKQKNVASAVSGSSVIVKKISVSYKNEMDLENTIYNEAEQYIPFDVNEVRLDFEVLERSIDMRRGFENGQGTDETEHLEIMLVAAKKDMVKDYVNLIQNAGLNPGVLDVDSFALQNAFEMNLAEKGKADAVCALVNVGAEELGINVVHNGESLFTRGSGFGGAQITETIMSRLTISYEEAEKVKLGGIVAEKDPDVLGKIFVSTVSAWVQEIKRAIDFVAGNYPHKMISKLVVCGGSCRIPGFQHFLQRETGLQVEELNPFRNLKVNEKMLSLIHISEPTRPY